MESTSWDAMELMEILDWDFEIAATLVVQKKHWGRLFVVNSLDPNIS